MLLYTSFCLPYVFINVVTIIVVANITANWNIPVDVYNCMIYGSQVYRQCSTTILHCYNYMNTVTHISSLNGPLTHTYSNYGLVWSFTVDI